MIAQEIDDIDSSDFYSMNFMKKDTILSFLFLH